jgi:hypothetical protein
VQELVDFGPVCVSAAALRDAIAPELDRSRADLHALLPRLARGRHAAFADRVGHAAGALSVRPASPDSFEEHLRFLEAFEGNRKALDRAMEDVEAHFDLCKVCWEPISAMHAQVLGIASNNAEVKLVHCRCACWGQNSLCVISEHFAGGLKLLRSCVHWHPCLLWQRSQPDAVSRLLGSVCVAQLWGGVAATL